MKLENSFQPLSFGLAACLLLVHGGSAFAWDSYKTMAKEFTRAAIKSNTSKVAVIPFASEAKNASPEGQVIADRLATQIARLGKLQLIERDLLDRVMREQYLMSTGAVQKEKQSPSGRIAPVDAIITGSIFHAEGKIEVHARMIEVGTGRVLYAATAEVEKEWSEIVQVPQLDVPIPSIDSLAPPVFHDALADYSCAQANDMVDHLENSILETKAIYWASQMKSPGFSMKKLTQNPGSEIINADLRAKFYEMLKTRFYQRSNSELSESQYNQMTQVEEKISKIIEKCNG